MAVELVRVTWMDAAAPGQLEQYSIQEAQIKLCPSLMEDYGLLLVDEPAHIVLGSQYDQESKEYRRCFIIPKLNIMKVELCKSYKDITSMIKKQKTPRTRG